MAIFSALLKLFYCNKEREKKDSDYESKCCDLRAQPCFCRQMIQKVWRLSISTNRGSAERSARVRFNTPPIST